LSGTGVISASGGAGACVPHCQTCDSARRCLVCDSGYTWSNYICKDLFTTTEVRNFIDSLYLSIALTKKKKGTCIFLILKLFYNKYLEKHVANT